MDSFGNILTEEDLRALNSALAQGDLCEATERLNESLREMENAPLNIAITGESGAGKSTFVNAIRGLDDEEDGSAGTGVVQTTMEPTPYPHPLYPNVTFWDLPGIGTPDFVADDYLQSVEFSRYDFFIIMSSERFKQNDIALAKAIQAMEKKFYFVRSKVDSDLQASKKRRKKTYNEENILNKIRNNCIESLNNGGITDPRVFLLSFLELDKYDFHEMQDTLGKELPKHKRHIFLMSLPNISLPVLERKRQCLREEIWIWALISSFLTSILLPGLSVACDVSTLVQAMNIYQMAFGLDKLSLQRLAEKFHKDIDELRSVMKSPLAVQEINEELVYSLLSTGHMKNLKKAQYIVKYIPVLGTMASMGISIGTTHWMLDKFFKEIAEDSARVLNKVLE